MRRRSTRGQKVLLPLPHASCGQRWVYVVWITEQNSRSWMPFLHGKNHHKFSLQECITRRETAHTYFWRNVVLSKHRHPSTHMALPPLTSPPYSGRCFRIPFKTMPFVLELLKYTFWGVSSILKKCLWCVSLYLGRFVWPSPHNAQAAVLQAHWSAHVAE